MSRAMVSRYLAELERWMGARLLHRTTRRLSLTGPGEEALNRARAMLALGEEMEHLAIRHDEAPRGNCASPAATLSEAPCWSGRRTTTWPVTPARRSTSCCWTGRSIWWRSESISPCASPTTSIPTWWPAGSAPATRWCAPAPPTWPAMLRRSRCRIWHCTTASPTPISARACGVSGARWSRIRPGERQPQRQHLQPAAGRHPGRGGDQPATRLLGSPPSGKRRPGPLLTPWQPKRLGVYAVYGTRKQMSPCCAASSTFSWSGWRTIPCGRKPLPLSDPCEPQKRGLAAPLCSILCQVRLRNRMP